MPETQTNIANQINRIRTDRDTIRTKFIELGLAQSNSNLDDLAEASGLIENRGSISVTVQEGETYTIPKGYHNGSGTVSGVSGGGNYTLQSKTVTPTKTEQNVTPDSGYYGLSDVTVNAIPENYNDVSSVTAVATDVLANKVFVDATGKVVAGTMANVGTINKTLTAETTSYSIAKGYHSGTGSVNVLLETKSVTPTKSMQTVSPTNGKLINSVTIAAIPDNFIDTSDATATASDILIGKSAYVGSSKLVGTMANNGSLALEIDGLMSMSIDIPTGYASGGVVTLTNDIEIALAAI